MRTTLDIDDEVLSAAKERARRERKTAGEVISELARRALNKSVLKCDLHIVSDSQQAIDYLLNRNQYVNAEANPRPDLVLLDLNMPKLDGRQVLERIKSDDDLKTLFIETVNHKPENGFVAESSRKDGVSESMSTIGG